MDLAEQLRQGAIGVIPTDTVYGIVTSALKPASVERIYHIKKRLPTKPQIVLIASVRDIMPFGIHITKEQSHWLDSVWPGPVSVILACTDTRFDYLMRGSESIAFRVPALQKLQTLLEECGPLVAPSANPEGMPPATTISEAQEYFGGDVDVYVDGGELRGTPSKILRLNTNGSFAVVRP